MYQQQYNVNIGTFKTDANGQPPAGLYPSYAPVAPNVFFQPPGPPLAAPFAGAATSQAINTNPPLGTLSARGLDPHFLNPYSHSFNMTVEQQMPFRSSLTIGWVGNRAMRLPIFIDTNLMPATTTKTYDVVDIHGNTQSTVSVPFYTQRVSQQTGSMLTGFSGVNSWYNSMAVTIEKPFDHGVQLLVNYTWANAIDGGQVSGVNGTFNGTDTPLDPFNRKAEYSRSDLDLRNRFVGSLVYSPTFTIAERPLRLLANGWTAAGTLTEQTGFPVTPFMNNSPSSPVGDGGVTGGELSLNNAGTPGRAPQLPRNTFPGPGLRNLDFRMGRNIPIHEGMYLQFFAEAFNLLNHQNRLSVNTTAFSYTNANSGVCSGHANGCISPYYVPATATTNASGTPFEATTSTTSILYGARQLQFSAKLFF